MKAHRVLIWVTFISLALDFSTKKLALQFLTQSPKRILGSFLQLHLAFNSGAAFSFAPSGGYFFALLAMIIIAVTLFFARRFTSAGWAFVAGLVLGGVSGNLLDRIFRAPGFLRGEVVDWIELPHWPTFNLADTSIFAAAVLACILTVKNISPIHPAPMNPRKVDEKRD